MIFLYLFFRRFKIFIKKFGPRPLKMTFFLGTGILQYQKQKLLQKNQKSIFSEGKNWSGELKIREKWKILFLIVGKWNEKREKNGSLNAEIEISYNVFLL